MGPLLFLLYINDLPTILDPETTCRLFADDCLIYRSIQTPEDRARLQSDLDKLHQWGETWGLRFNVSKCHMMHLSRSRNSPTRYYSLGGEMISAVSEAKYLGVILSNCFGTRKSPWKPHIIESVAKATQRPLENGDISGRATSRYPQGSRFR